MSARSELKFPKPDSRAPRESRLDYSKLALAKNAPQPDARFREYTRNLGCQVRRRSPKAHPKCSPTIGTDYTRRPLIDFAHTPAQRGVSQKASDVGNGVGLCHDLHMEQERIGWPRFAKKYDIDPKAIAQELADAYEGRFGKTNTPNNERKNSR